MTTEEIMSSWVGAEYEIHGDGSVSLLSDFDLRSAVKGLKEFPVSLRTIKKNVDMSWSETLTTLGGLTTVGGALILRGCPKLTDLGSLRTVRGQLHLGRCPMLRTLGELQRVGGTLPLYHCPSLTDLGELRELPYGLDISGCSSLNSLYGVRLVRRSLSIRGCNSLSSLGDLKFVGELVYHSDDTRQQGSTWADFKGMWAGTLRTLEDTPEQAPMLLVTSPYAWQRALALQTLNGAR